MSHCGKCENMRTKITAHLNPAIVFLGTKNAAVLAFTFLEYFPVALSVYCAGCLLPHLWHRFSWLCMRLYLKVSKHHIGKNPVALLLFVPGAKQNSGMASEAPQGLPMQDETWVALKYLNAIR